MLVLVYLNHSCPLQLPVADPEKIVTTYQPLLAHRTNLFVAEYLSAKRFRGYNYVSDARESQLLHILKFSDIICGLLLS
jgi:hypothetical protein